MRGRTIVGWLLLAALAFAAERGVRPLPKAEGYPAFTETPDYLLGVKVLNSKEVLARFVSDLNRAGYMVLEVAVYPAGGKTVEVGRGDFLLFDRRGNRSFSAADPADIAALVQKANRSDREITLYPTGGVGYSNRGGWGTGAGIGVGIGDSRSGGTAADRRTMELELSEKALPEGKASQPVAGYLYFHLEDREKRPAGLELEFSRPNTAPVKLRLRVPKD